VPSGLNLTVNRVYNASLGRWINRDPIDEVGGINLYAYVSNNPICLTDLAGTDALGAAWGGAIGAIVGGLAVGGGGTIALPGGGTIGGAEAGAGAGGALGTAVGSMIPAQIIINNIGNGLGKGINNLQDYINKAQRGNNNKENEWSRAAENQKDMDPCRWLELAYAAATNSKDRLKIDCALKVLGCKNKTKRSGRGY